MSRDDSVSPIATFTCVVKYSNATPRVKCAAHSDPKPPFRNRMSACFLPHILFLPHVALHSIDVTVSAAAAAAARLENPTQRNWHAMPTGVSQRSSCLWHSAVAEPRAGKCKNTQRNVLYKGIPFFVKTTPKGIATDNDHHVLLHVDRTVKATTASSSVVAIG